MVQSNLNAVMICRLHPVPADCPKTNSPNLHASTLQVKPMRIWVTQPGGLKGTYTAGAV